MSNMLEQASRFKTKSLLVSAAFLGFCFVVYKFMMPIFDPQVWEAGMNADIAELMVIADHRLDKAKMAVDWDCGAFTLSGKDEGAGCADARKELAAAQAHKAEVEAKRSTTLSHASQTKRRYDGIMGASQQKLMPFYGLVFFGLLLFLAILFFLLPKIQKALNKEGACSSVDGLR